LPRGASRFSAIEFGTVAVSVSLHGTSPWHPVFLL
jgi:hypothetical protein